MTTDRARFVAQFTRPTTPPPVSVLAVAGLVLAVLGLSPVGALLSLFGLQDIRDGGRRGQSTAVAGLVLGIAGSLVWAYAVVRIFTPDLLR